MISTGTHGVGAKFGCFSSFVTELVLVLADGSVVACSRDRDPDLFAASLCGLGATGIIVRASVQCEPAFRLREHKFSMPARRLADAIDEGLLTSAEHVRVWYVAHIGMCTVSRLTRTTEVRDRHRGSRLIS